MIERDTLKQMITAANQSVAHEEQAAEKYRSLVRQAEQHRDKHRAEAGALTQLLELWYPDEQKYSDVPL